MENTKAQKLRDNEQKKEREQLSFKKKTCTKVMSFSKKTENAMISNPVSNRSKSARKATAGSVPLHT